jgi:hypothetical protein
MYYVKFYRMFYVLVHLLLIECYVFTVYHQFGFCIMKVLSILTITLASCSLWYSDCDVCFPTIW